jgi:hypothetical protein
MAHAFPYDEQITNLEQANRARERTVFVVNAEHLTDFLTGWKLDPSDAFSGYKLQQRHR